MRSLALTSIAFLLSSSVLGACADDVPVTTEGQSSSSGSSGSTGTTGADTTTAGTASASTTSPTTTEASGTSGPTTTGATATTDATTDATSSSGSTTEGTSGSTTGGEATCCQAGMGPLCGDPAIEACVCAVDPFCCEQAWDDTCVGEVNKLGCGDCPVPEAACCEVGQGPGCLEDPVEACVCAQQPQCCDTLWGPECVAAVEQLGCGMCAPKGECCAAHMGGGCVDADVEACVCAQLPQCCEGAWTDECVAAVEQGGCGTCGGGGGMCCMVQDGPGCGDMDVEACVCGQDPFCCDQQWDDQCVSEVEQLGCGTCGGGGGECCMAGMGPGCADAGIESCVCAAAPSCCESLWSDACAALVESLGCGTCGGGGTGCCEAHDSPSCDDQAIADCVCAQDDFCCASSWDGLCVSEVEQFGCGMCG